MISKSNTSSVRADADPVSMDAAYARQEIPDHVMTSVLFCVWKSVSLESPRLGTSFTCFDIYICQPCNDDTHPNSNDRRKF